MLATIAMAAMLVAVVFWSIGLWQVAPTLFFGNEGILATSTLLAVMVTVLVMGSATVVAARAITQGMVARRSSGNLA